MAPNWQVSVGGARLPTRWRCGEQVEPSAVGTAAVTRTASAAGTEAEAAAATGA